MCNEGQGKLPEKRAKLVKYTHSAPSMVLIFLSLVVFHALSSRRFFARLQFKSTKLPVASEGQAERKERQKAGNTPRAGFVARTRSSLEPNLYARELFARRSTTQLTPRAICKCGIVCGRVPDCA